MSQTTLNIEAYKIGFIAVEKCQDILFYGLRMTSSG